MSKIKITMKGFDRFRLSFPELDEPTSVILETEDLESLRYMLNEILDDPDCLAFTMGGWEA